LQPRDDTISDSQRRLDDALGQVVSLQRHEWTREWTRELALITAQAEATIANLRTEAIELRTANAAQVREAIANMAVELGTRLATLRDGAPGPQGPVGPPGPIGAVGERGEPGERGEQGERGNVGEQGSPGPSGVDGAPGAIGPVGPSGLDGAPGAIGPQGESGPAGERGLEGPSGPAGATGERGLPGENGGIGPQGEPGERGDTGLPGPMGERGPTGLLPIAAAFRPGAVHYAGNVVAHAGGLWQALRDTAQTPPSDEWICLARPGRDARSPQVKGTWQEGEEYGELDIVALNGGTYIARKPDPGPCPGEGWQSLVQARNGKQGPPGPPGPSGERGGRGTDAPAIARWQIDRANYVAIPIMSDGKKGPPLELRGLFEQFQVEAR
jgi:hypothetical protein